MSEAGTIDVRGSLPMEHSAMLLRAKHTAHTITEAVDAPPPTGQHLPADAAARMAVPLLRGVFDYFPDALAAIAEVSRVGSEQHHPGTGIWWEKGKSADHGDCLLRHLVDRGTLDTDGCRHSAKVAWRALALLQIEIEAERLGQPLPPPGAPQYNATQPSRVVSDGHADED